MRSNFVIFLGLGLYFVPINCASPVNTTDLNAHDAAAKEKITRPEISALAAAIATDREISDPPVPSAGSPLDRVDVDSYLKNKRAMQLQIKCVIYDGPCDIVGREVKKYIVVGLTGKCTRCSSRLKIAVEKVATHIQENYPQAWYDAIYKYLVAPTLGETGKSSTKAPVVVTSIQP